MVLDLACGHGRHSRLFSAQGATVTALDHDAGVLAAMTGLQGITTVNADVEGGPWPFDRAAFDAIVVTNYLHRPLFPHLLEALAGGGVLIYETFMAGNERFGKPSNPEFLLRPGELLESFGQACQVIAFEQGSVAMPKPAVVQRICLKNQQNTAALTR
jgi:SAM-dependent methyltransferase